MRRGRSQAAPPPACCAVSCRVASRLAMLRRGVSCRVEWSGRCAAGWACPAALLRGRILPPDETQATPARAVPPPRETHTTPARVILPPGETQATPARPQHYDSSQFRHAGAAAVTPARTTRHAGAVPVSPVPARPFVWGGHARELPAVTTPRGQLPLRDTRPRYQNRAAHLLAAARSSAVRPSTTCQAPPSPWPRSPREAERPTSDQLTTGRQPVRRGVHE